jgi:tetratricopeptide (TPR) repeat protein
VFLVPGRYPKEYARAKQVDAWQNPSTMKAFVSTEFGPQAAGPLFAFLLAGACAVQGASASTRPSLLIGPTLGLAARQMAESGPPPQAPSALLGNQIARALAKGDSETARRLVPQLLSVLRLPADTLLRTGVDLAGHDMYPEATQVFGRCTKDFPELFEGYYNLALAELGLGQYSEALAMLEKAPRTTPSGEVSRAYLRGKIEAALGKNPEAERDLRAAFAAAPREENYALDLGLYYLRTQKYQEGLAVFRKATSLRKDSPFLQLGLGVAQLLGGRREESIETCRAILAAQPDFSPARVMLAFNLYFQGSVEEAEKTAAEGLRAPNPFPYLFYLRAVSLIRLQSDDFDLMLNDLTVAARAIPRCSLCYLAMSKVHQRKGARSLAMADLEKAVELDPTFAEAWYRLAMLYELDGQPQAARQARQRFEALKEDKADRETEMLRDVFVKALGGEASP